MAFPTTNLVSYWKLDETSGTSAADSTSNGNTLALQSQASFISGGKINYGLQPATANASGGGATSSASSLDTSAYPLSLSAWFKTTHTTAVSNGDMFIFQMTIASSPYSRCLLGIGTGANAGKMFAEYVTSAGNFYTTSYSASNYADGVFHHAVLTIDGSGNMIVYVDGVSVKTGTASGSMSTGKTFAVGVNRPSATDANMWIGTLDEIGYWTRALTSTEVTTLYNGGAGLTYSTSTAYTSTLTETITLTDTLSKRAGKALLETFTFSDTFTFLRAWFSTLSETITNTDVLSKGPGKTLTEAGGGATSSGPNSPGTMGVDNTEVGAIWTNPDNAKIADSVYASVHVSAVDGNSNYLKATNFGFSIPTGATIDGILVEVKKYATSGGSEDFHAKIVKGGTIGATNKAITASYWPTSNQYVSYGASSDLWGETWAASDINASTFGFVLSSNLVVNSSDDFYVDHIRITVYYTTTGGITLTDTFSTASVLASVLTETITYTDTLLRSIARSLSETVTLSDTFTTIRSRFSTLTEMITLSDTLATIRSRFTALAETLTFSDTLIRSTARVFTEAVTYSDILVRRIARSFAETITLTGTLTRQIARALSDTLTVTDSLSKGIARAFSETLTFTDSLTRQITRVFAETIAFTDSVARQIARIFSDTITYVDSVAAGRAIIMSETVTLSDTLVRQITRTFEEVLTFTDTVAKQISRIFEDTVTYTDTVTRNIGRTFTETVTFTDTFIRQIARSLGETLALTDTLTSIRARFQTLSETVTFTDTFVSRLLTKMKKGIAILMTRGEKLVLESKNEAVRLRTKDDKTIL